MSALLEIEDLRVEFATHAGVVRAVDGCSLRLERGDSLSIVGESGSGKSTLALAILRLDEQATISGRVMFAGRDLRTFSADEMRAVRGARIALISQEPLSALDPVFTIGEQVAETLRAHRSLSRAEARARSIELLHKVGLPEPERAYSLYPHQMSGGMRQRAVIASAIACEPELLVADEPTSALDVTVRAQILALLRTLQRESGMSLLLITHDLAVAAENTRRIAVMYAGKIVEEGLVDEVLRAPRHPYTALSLRARESFGKRATRLAPIPGSVESALERASGCRFRLRCPLAAAVCAEREPTLDLVDPPANSQHRAACHFVDEASRL